MNANREQIMQGFEEGSGEGSAWPSTDWRAQRLARALVILALIHSAVAIRVSWASDYPWQPCFEVASELHDVPLELLLAVAATESNWNPDAVSHANAHGLMQIQWPGTARHLGVTRLSELYNPCLNIELGARYLRELLDRNDGDLPRALASYNYGPTRIDSLAELPSGALRYVATVEAHRGRIASAAAGPTLAVSRAAAAELREFDHHLRAERHAAAMNRQISSARFEVVELDDGRHGVRMEIGAQGLSMADASRLRALGWSDGESVAETSPPAGAVTGAGT